jgi:hypothetical protein
MIFVGIAWPGNYFENRNRDFTPTHTSIDSVSGGAQKFLEVIKDEIIKKIDSAYRTDKTKNGLLGTSSGGLFVLYTLFTEPSLFNRYIANSPSLWYDNNLIFLLEKSFVEKHHELNAKLFTSSGGYEEEFDPVSFKKFIAQVQASKYKGLEIESLVVDKTGHGSAGPYAISRGLQFVFSKPDIILDTLLLDQYAGHYEQGVTIARTGNCLYMNIPGGKIRMHAASNDSFYMNGAPGTGEFTKDDKGKVIGYTVKSGSKGFFAKKLD